MPELLRNRPWLGLLAAVLVYLSLTLPVLSEHGLANDELIDMKIAMSYISTDWGWLRDIDLDASQTRLPMYAAAAANAILGTESLILSRLLSVICGVLSLVGVYWFCVRELSPDKGILAAVLLALSAYFLAFTRVAMTEGDAWVAVSGIGLALATCHLARRQTVGAAVLAGVAGGLVVSVKFTAAIWFPAALAAFLVLARGRPRETTPPAVHLLLIPLLGGLGAVLTGWWLVPPDDVYHLDQYYRHHDPVFLVWHAAAVAAAWLIFAVSAARWRAWPVSRFAAIWLAGLGAALTFFIAPPVHTTNPGIAQELARAFMANNDGLPEGIRYSSFVLHFLVIFVKSGPAMGILVLGALLAAPWFLRRRPALVVPLLFILLYVAFYVYMGRGQTFYMIGVMPFLAILAADFLGELLRRSRFAFAAIFALVSLNAGADIGRSYPDMHLNGYQWLGERYIAHRSSLGYKSVAQTPSDGTVQVVDWAIGNIEPGKRVTTYLRERIAIHYLGPRSGVRFQVNNGFRDNAGIDHADYVLVHINATLRQFESSDRPLAIEARRHTTARSAVDEGKPESVRLYPFDKATLEREFEKVFAVQRAFGIEVASVWRRR